MRHRVWVILALLLASAGCIGDDDASMQDTGGEQADLPAPVHDERYVEAAANPLGTAEDQPCEAGSSSCYRYPFSVDTDARIQARLDWTNATNDFDLHVFDHQGEEVASAATGPLETRETLDEALDPGSYELVVVAWLVSEDTYDLEAQFGYR